VADSTDIIVIGGGPVGLYALYYAGQRSMTAKVIDALPELGGQLWALYPDNDIYDVAGVPKLKARDLVANLKKQALQYKPEVVMGERVVGIHKLKDGFEVTTDSGGRHTTRAVLLAPGPGAFIPGAIYDKPAKEQKKRGLFIEPHHATELADRRVLICGGKREAVGWAIDAATVADAVTVINCSEIYTADEARVDSMFTRHVDVMTPYELLEIHGREKVEAATIVNSETRKQVRLKVDAVLMARGQLTNLEPIRTWGVELKENGIAVERTMQTSIPGIFAAGDIVHYPGKLKTIVSGAGEAAIAVNNAKAFIDPKASPQPRYTAEG
jgi:thioredoxin reductase